MSNLILRIYLNIILLKLTIMKIGISIPNNYKLNDSIKDLIEIKTITENDLMQTIIDSIKLNPEMMGETSTIYEDHKIIYQFCHLDYNNPNTQKDDNTLNNLCSYLNILKEKVYGVCVILKFIIDKDYKYINSDIDIEELNDIIYKKENHKGVIIKTDNKIEEFDFKQNYIFETFGKDKIKDYACVEVRLLKYSFNMYLNKHAKDYNLYASKIDKYAIKGDVYIVGKIHDTEFCDITKDIIEKVLDIFFNNIDKYKELGKDDFKSTDKLCTNAPILLNFKHKCLINDKDYIKYHNKYDKKDIENLKKLMPLNESI